MGTIERNSILIVDDEEINLDILRSILLPDYTVLTVKGGIAALEMVGQYLPDIILLDILMPDMNGFEVLERLKKAEKTRDIPVVIITTLNSTEDEEMGLRLGATDYIAKPFNSTIVQSRVRNLMQIVNQIRAIEQYSRNMELTLSKRLEAIVNNYNGAIWSIDNKGFITYFNGQYLKKIGITPSFLIGKHIEEIRTKYRHLEFVDNVEKTFREGAQNWLTETDGMIFRGCTTLIRDNEGNITGIVGSSDDVTELIKLQRDLEAAVKAAEAANHSKSSFLAKMSHEIRTPLNAVLGIAEVQLQNETLQPDVKEGYARIFHSGDLLLGIINDILDMSKIEAGKLELVPAKYNVASLINDAIYLNMIKHEEKPIVFILNVDENIPSELIGDELRIKQILNNLLTNSFKYTREGEVELSINAEYTSSDSVTLIFHVRDTGQGMTPEQVSRMFDEYSRFVVDINRTTEGTGLGMGIAQNLAHMMNGDILVKSELGKGSLFTVRLPQGNPGAAPLGKETVERLKQFHLIYEAKMEKLQIAREPIPFGKVLVVDDVEMNLYVTKGMLSPYGLQIDSALSGFEAIEKVKRNTYDMVFMDHMMPIMDGIEVTREIRKWEDEEYLRRNGLSEAEVSKGSGLPGSGLPGSGLPGSHVPIIALTANAVSGMKEMFLSHGFNGFISKPVILQELDLVLKEFMSPEKITEYQKPSAEDTDTQYDGFIQDIGKIGDIDTAIGLNQVTGNKRLYRNTLEKFYQKLSSICDDMTSSLDNKDLKNFTVSAHSMKSMLSIIGAMSLSATALELEIASGGNEIDFCMRLFGEFKEKLLSLHKQLAAVFQNAAPDNARETAQSGSAPQKSFTGKILLVDDTEMVLYVNKEKLLAYGLEVDTAASGAEALDKVKNNAYNLVFMDHVMREMDGIEATRQIRKLGQEYEKLPVIAVTANITSSMEEMFLTNGLDGFLSKPIAREKLEGILEKWLGAAGG